MLNHLFNLVGYNPNGREGPDKAGRDEGYLFWIAWLQHNGAALFSTLGRQRLVPPGLARRHVRRRCARSRASNPPLNRPCSSRRSSTRRSAGTG